MFDFPGSFIEVTLSQFTKKGNMDVEMQHSAEVRRRAQVLDWQEQEEKFLVEFLPDACPPTFERANKWVRLSRLYSPSVPPSATADGQPQPQKFMVGQEIEAYLPQNGGFNA